MPILAASDPQHARYVRVKQKMESAGLGDFIISPHMLKVENVITGSLRQYKFDLFQNKQADRASELKLNRNDGFFITHMGLGVYNATAGSEGQAAIYTWPNDQVFSAAGEAAALEQFYRGAITLTTSPVERFQDYATENLKYNPGYTEDTTNFYAAIGQGFWGPTPEQRGLHPLEPMVILDGYMDNSYRLDLGPGDPAAAATPAAGENVVLLMLYGYKVINGAQVLGNAFLR